MTNDLAVKRNRLKTAHDHVEEVFGESAIGALIKRELQAGKDFAFAGAGNGLVERVAEEVIRLQEARAKMPDPRSS